MRAPTFGRLLLPIGLVLACSGDDGKETGAELAGPRLSHTPPTGVVEETSVRFEVTAADPDGVASVAIFHRISGDTTWVQTPMTPGEGDVWSADVEAEDIDAPSVEYYFKATDAAETPSTTYLPTESTAAPYELPVSVVGVTLPFEEPFEHGDDDGLYNLGWGSATLEFRGYAWETATAQAYAGTRSAFHSRGHSEASEMDDWLISPALDFSAVTTAQVTWWELGSGTADANHGLYLSTGSRDPADGEFVPVAEALPAPPEGTWGRSAVYDLSAWAGQPTVYLAWRFIGQDADDWYIDDVSVDELGPDLSMDVAVSPAPIDPGASGTFTVTIDNSASVDASDLSVTVTFPEGGAAVAEPSVTVTTVPGGGEGTADFSLTIDAATPDNSYVPYEITVTDARSTWTAEGDLLVGLASVAEIVWAPAAEGAVSLSLGVGDPDAPTWEQEVYDGTTASPVELSVDITEQGVFLPPAAGDLRWFLRVDSAVAGTVEAFEISYDGVTHAATVLPRVAADVEAVAWLPEPPDFEVTAVTSPATVAPGDSGVGVGLYVVNTGNDTQGPVQATLTTLDPDVTLVSGGPVALTTEVFAGGASVNLADLFTIDVSPTHVDSSDLSLSVLLDDGVETWTVPLAVAVPFPYLEISSVELDDDDRDGELDPDESGEISLRITNVGDLATEGDLTAILSVEATSTANVTISGGAGEYRELLPTRSDSPDDPWDIEITGGSAGDTIDLLLTLTDEVRTYEARTTLRLGEPPWQPLDTSYDTIGDALAGWDFDIYRGWWRVDDGVLQLRLEAATAFDPDTLFIESWGLSTVADWTYYRIVVQSGVATVEGYDSGFTTISEPVLSYPTETQVQVDITLADLGLSLDTLSLGFASGWCGPDTYYCDHYPDGWGYPYVSWAPSLFFELSW
jgi:hypothetical protein